MSGDEVNPYPIQLLFNYWEFCPTLGGTAASFTKKSPLTARLDELVRQGVTEVTSFLPWQAIETDITHTLPRFLMAAAERKLRVSLIATPELGVHYPNSGLPKDTVRVAAERAEHCDQGPIPVTVPPNVFALPSFFNPDFGKRYYNFLARVDGLLNDLSRTQPQAVERVRLISTGSFWKYYRSPLRSSRQAFGGIAGDFSGAASVIFRQRVEQYYNQREFQVPSPLAANRWKTKALDSVNRRWFFQQSEDVFRHRTFNALGKRIQGMEVREIELFTPETDPGFAYSHLLQTMSGGHGDLSRLSALVDQLLTRATFGSAAPAAPYVHWCGMGGFRGLADSQKQFLILKSLLLAGGQGGGIFLDEADWFSLSQAFRTRASAIARLLQYRELALGTEALYLAPHLWSSGGLLWEELYEQAGFEARVISSLDSLLVHRDAKIAIVDPEVILRRDTVERLVRWAELGKTVAIPRSALYSESARHELEQLARTTRKMDVNFSVPYQLHLVGAGRIAIYECDLPASDASGSVSAKPWQNFIASLLAVAEIDPFCRMTDPRTRAIPLRRGKTGGAIAGVFVLNDSYQALASELTFEKPVAISDFATAFKPLAPGQEKPAAAEPPTVSTQFELNLGPCGVVALAIDRMDSPLREQADLKPALQPIDGGKAAIAAAALRAVAASSGAASRQRPAFAQALEEEARLEQADDVVVPRISRLAGQVTANQVKSRVPQEIFKAAPGSALSAQDDTVRADSVDAASVLGSAIGDDMDSGGFPAD